MKNTMPTIEEIIEKNKENIKAIAYRGNTPYGVYYTKEEYGYMVFDGKTRHVFTCNSKEEFDSEAEIFY